MEQAIIEGAYLMGFEPTTDNITPAQLFAEAQEYLLSSSTK